MNRIDFVYRTHFKNEGKKKKHNFFSCLLWVFRCCKVFSLVRLAGILKVAIATFQCGEADAEQWCADGAVRVLPDDHLRPVPESCREPGAVVAAGRGEHVPDPGSQRGKESLLLLSACAWLQPLYGLWPHLYVSGILRSRFSQKKLLTEQVWTGGSTLICFTELVKSSHFLPQSHAGRRFSVRNFILSVFA